MRRVLDNETRVALAEAGNELLVGREGAVTAALVAREIADGVHREAGRRQRVEHGGKLAVGTHEETGALTRGVDAESHADPGFARRHAGLDEERARRAPRGLDHHERRIGLEQAGEIIERR